jgi:hypothetical protein
VKSEAQAKPVPQLVLACCTYLAATGLKEPCLFQHEPPAELVAALASAMGGWASGWGRRADGWDGEPGAEGRAGGGWWG